MGKVKPYTIFNVHETAKSKGDKLLSTEYKIVTEPLLFECPIGHKFRISYRWYKDKTDEGTGCPICRNKKMKWTGIEESILEELYGRLPMTGLVEKFNARMVTLHLKPRSLEAIAEKIYTRFGNTVKPELDWYTISDFSNQIKIERNFLASWARHKKMPVTKFGNIRYINPIKFREWIKNKKEYLHLLSKDAEIWLEEYTISDQFHWKDVLIDKSDLEIIKIPLSLRPNQKKK